MHCNELIWKLSFLEAEFSLAINGGFSDISTQLVPEPGTIGLLAVALLVAGGAAARRRK